MSIVKTPVKFLIEKESGEIMAFFPRATYNKLLYGNDMKTCYVHNGQHSACLVSYANECTPATAAQYEDLKRELEGQGYTLNIMNK